MSRGKSPCSKGPLQGSSTELCSVLRGVTTTCVNCWLMQPQILECTMGSISWLVMVECLTYEA